MWDACVPEDSLDRIHQVTSLKSALDLAIRDEDYGRAATLRDEIQELETSKTEAQGSETQGSETQDS